MTTLACSLPNCAICGQNYEHWYSDGDRKAICERCDTFLQKKTKNSRLVIQHCTKAVTADDFEEYRIDQEECDAECQDSALEVEKRCELCDGDQIQTVQCRVCERRVCCMHFRCIYEYCYMCTSCAQEAVPCKVCYNNVVEAFVDAEQCAACHFSRVKF